MHVCVSLCRSFFVPVRDHNSQGLISCLNVVSSIMFFFGVSVALLSCFVNRVFLKIKLYLASCFSLLNCSNVIN